MYINGRNRKTVGIVMRQRDVRHNDTQSSKPPPHLKSKLMRVYVRNLIWLSDK